MMPRLIPRNSREPDPRGVFVTDVAEMWDGIVGKPFGNLVFDERSQTGEPMGRPFGNVSMGGGAVPPCDIRARLRPPYIPLDRTLRLRPVYEGRFENLETWLFAIPDDRTARDGTVMLSAGYGQKLVLYRADPSDSSILTDELPQEGTFDLKDLGVPVQDHWHVYSGGLHWISYSYNDHYLGIATFDEQGVLLERTCLISGNEGDFPSVDNPWIRLGSPKYGYQYTTNDHFIMPWDEGILVGVMDRSSSTIPNIWNTSPREQGSPFSAHWGQRLVLYKVHSDFTLDWTRITLTHPASNFASGFTLPERDYPLYLLVPGQGGISGGCFGIVPVRIDADGRWAPTQPPSIFLDDEDLFFGTLARPGHNWSVITFWSLPRTKEEKPIPISPIIRRCIFDPDDNLCLMEDIVVGGDRPHTRCFTAPTGKSYLLTTWDAQVSDSGRHTFIRVEEIDFTVGGQ